MENKSPSFHGKLLRIALLQMTSNVVFRIGYVLHLQSVKVLLQSSHFLNVCLHEWTLVILVDLSHHKL